ncbi:MAG: hypothetical protein JRJ65_14190 [Deltaproteobacteria bacterium]|nr:hypothetical protein [Deltaproteobacteria bacterium]
MKKSIILILSLSLIFISGCKNETEKAEEIDTSQDKAVVQTQAPAGTPEAQEAKEEKPPQEVFITIQEGKFEPKAKSNIQDQEPGC